MATPGSNQHRCVAPRDPTLAYVGSWQPGAVCICGSPLKPTCGQFHQSSFTSVQCYHTGDRREGSIGITTTGIYEPMAEYLSNFSDQRIARTNGLTAAYRGSKSHRHRESKTKPPTH
ncbi:hypothetical protein ANO14919_143810 [Xylariales sp. No.14919]|nr:hypothetical protein ANO14919_143810 [Xylariales sp. No.14919]